VVAVTSIKTDLDRMAELRGAGTISEREWLAMRRPLLARLEQAQAQLPHRLLDGWHGAPR